MTDIDPRALLSTAHRLRQALLGVLALLALLAVFVVLFVLRDASAVGLFLARDVVSPETELRAWQGTALAALVLAQIALWSWAVLRGRAVFTALAAEDVTAAGHAAAQTGRLLWALLALGLLAQPAASVVATWHFPEGERALTLTLNSGHLSTGLAALLAGFTAQAFALGAALWQEHREVI